MPGVGGQEVCPGFGSAGGRQKVAAALVWTWGVLLQSRDFGSALE